nr:F-box domain, cyclin-like protein [Tanacetum cinerariifolium]
DISAAKEQLYEVAKSKVAKLEEKIQMQDEVITEQKLVHEKLLSHIIKCKIADLHVQVEAGNPDYEIIRSMSNEIESVMFFSPYEVLKSLFLTRIDASEWEKIVTELGSIRHFERTRSTDIHTQSNAPADMATSSRVA